MRRSSSLLVVGALAVLGLFALTDTLRAPPAEPAPAAATEPREEPPTDGSGPPLLPGREALAAELRAGEITGALFLTDEACRAWGLLLPAAQWLSAVARPHAGCELSVSENGRQFLVGERAAWQPNGSLVAVCREGSVELLVRRGLRRLRALREACAPAWTPDARLTYVSRNEVLESTPAGPRVLVDRRALAEAAAAASSRFQHFYAPAALAVAWLSPRRALVVFRVRQREQQGSRLELLAFFQDGKLEGKPLTNADWTDVRVSPRRGYAVARGTRPRGLAFLAADGRLLARNPVASATAATWSPDERWTAVATAGKSIFVFPSDRIGDFDANERPPLLRIPVYAVDVAWR